MFTYTSPGFGRVIQKLMKKRKIKPLDIVDPHEVVCQDIKYTYKFKGIFMRYIKIVQTFSLIN